MEEAEGVSGCEGIDSNSRIQDSEWTFSPGQPAFRIFEFGIFNPILSQTLSRMDPGRPSYSSDKTTSLAAIGGALDGPMIAVMPALKRWPRRETSRSAPPTAARAWWIPAPKGPDKPAWGHAPGKERGDIPLLIEP